MLRKAIVGLAAVVASATVPAGVAAGESEPHGERYIERGRSAHGFLYLPHGRKRADWVVIERFGALGPVVKPGEGMAEREVESNGEFKLKLLPGTYTFGARHRQPEEAGRLCGRTVLTVRAHKPIPVIRVRCRR